MQVLAFMSHCSHLLNHPKLILKPSVPTSKVPSGLSKIRS